MVKCETFLLFNEIMEKVLMPVTWFPGWDVISVICWFAKEEITVQLLEVSASSKELILLKQAEKL